MTTLPAIKLQTAPTPVPDLVDELSHMYLQTVIAGPFKDYPPCKPDGPERPGLLNGKWYKMTLKAYPCPVCSNMKEIIL